MRLLQVIAELGRGGAERIVLDLAADAVARGDEVVVASAGGVWVERVGWAGATHRQVPLHHRRATDVVTAGIRLAGEQRRFRPDVVHTHNVGAAAATWLGSLAMRHRPSSVCTVHGLAHDDYPRAARILRRMAPFVVACAPAVQRRLVDAGYPEDRIEVIPNGAGLAAPTDDAVEAARERLGLDDRSVAIGVGRLVPQKAWSTLLEATAGRHDLQVVVVGEGPLRSELEDEARRWSSPVRFVGAVDDVAAVLGAADCFVSTSAWEGLPLSLLEALSLGVPAIATAVDGVTDVVPEGAALLVAPGDPAATGRALEDLLGDPDRRRSLSAAASRASRAWSPDRMLDGYHRLYERLAAGR